MQITGAMVLENPQRSAIMVTVDFGVDTGVGLWNTVTKPDETIASLWHAGKHPVKTGKHIGGAIKDSFVRDMINGDAESRSHWVTYALGTTVTSVVGTKGAGAVSKTGAATTKAGAQKAAQATSKAAQNAKNLELPNLLPYGPRYQFAANGSNVPYNVVDGMNLKDQLISRANLILSNPKTRLPRTNGTWVGEPGNGKWHTEKNGALEITKGEPVEFKNNRPNFSPWSKGQLKFKDGQLNGSVDDFKLVYKKIMKTKGFKNQSEAKKWLKNKGLTPHHVDSNTIQLVPTKLHKNIPHIGSASDLRGGY